MNNKEMTIGQRIQHVLKERNKSQKNLASAIGVSTSRINKLINKEDNNFESEILTSIAKALGVSYEWLADSKNAGSGKPSIEAFLMNYEEKFEPIKREFENRYADAKDQNFFGINGLKETAYDCIRIEEFLNEIIFGSENYSNNSFTPTKAECLALGSAVYICKIGMFYGIFPTESPLGEHETLTESVKEDINNHVEERTAKYLINHWNSPEWSKSEIDILAKICLYQSKDYDINKFYPAVVVNESGEEIRAQVLAALLKLAMACQVDQSHLPRSMRVIYEDLKIPRDLISNSSKTKLITGIDFLHSKEKIVLNAICPMQYTRGLSVRFDLKEIIEICRADIQENLEIVSSSVLNKYSNLSFTKVEAKIEEQPISASIPEMCFSVWPYFLGRPTSGTETAEALTQILMFAVELSFSNHPLVEDLKGTISKIVSICRERYPANLLLIGLEKEIGQIFASAEAEELGKKLHNNFQNYLQRITTACKIISEKKWDEYIGVDDAIIVYSYSIPFIQSLDKIRNYYKGPVYIINCEPIRDKNQQEPDENEKMLKYLRQNAFNTYFLKLKSFGRLLDTLELEKRKVKIILGIFGEVCANDKKLYMCQNGASLLARAAKSCPGAETYLIAESEKLGTEIKAEEIKTQTDLRFMNYCPQYDVTYFGSRVDLVSEDLIKGIITNSGKGAGAIEGDSGIKNC